MRQPSLFGFCASDSRRALRPGTPVVDLFCGIGGFSEGATAAGHRVVLAVDSDATLLEVHERNHPEAAHFCLTLPCATLPLPLPTEGDWHLHASPPCTKLSIMQPGVTQAPAERREAADLVGWVFQLVKDAAPTSWSLEQVNHEKVRAQLTALKSKHPMLFDWDVFDAAHAGVPQHRKRIVAGSPWLIANLRALDFGAPVRCVRDVIPNPPRPFIRNNLYWRPDEKTGAHKRVPLHETMRSVDEPCWTVLAAGHARWADAEGNILRHLTGAEKALIQGFPHGYALPENLTLCKVGVGNALPPPLARELMRA
jgi:DNA (cytosine-5)-methyltransferase 1